MARILLLGILPRSGPFGPKIKEINENIVKLAKDPKVYFLDMYDSFQSNGKIISHLFTDGLHLSAEGYQVWYDLMEPKLNKILRKNYRKFG